MSLLILLEWYGSLLFSSSSYNAWVFSTPVPFLSNSRCLSLGWPRRHDRPLWIRQAVVDTTSSDKVYNVLCSVWSDSLLTHALQPTRLLCPRFSRQEVRVGCHFLLQGIFLTQGSSLSLLLCRQILYCQSREGPSQGLPGPQIMVAHYWGEGQAGIFDPVNIPLISQNPCFKIGTALVIILLNVTTHLSYICVYLLVISKNPTCILDISAFKNTHIKADGNNFCSLSFNVIRSISYYLVYSEDQTITFWFIK